ncbi:hypothetical protein BB776_01535 [Planococcus salinarum]|uniref:DinB-like domain-containing protein n=1 Tax=Planococcus salinarum TaxID=622695 RepID=A0ABX3D1K9_9BACL|nr:hypothetical protein [Planococcus salinarum]OHX53934.1 hypothetical protein BB776_01535 [Planococcus salinarum]
MGFGYCVFSEGLQEAEQEAGKDLSEQVVAGREDTRTDYLQTIVLHNTYHAGQVVFARKITGDWLRLVKKPDEKSSGI